ncbi:helix-turn-helix domain-containing protein [Bartonella krasnovii]|uniref:helix-turn-helix domain-containing protein n=1 Tax=Bartonella krasnovii TaxID=2267275 RepID=UPI001F4C91CC|nr:helix-turn-helix transcriptional regulator [Bartonella krasnovii]UNF38385.1 helix-turn-helix domain-containing protein [Bartonella krasnovii]UNF49922.1 helix-turn-helix domain-containing protein [Bartonella krasnovii]UNF51647.1 helix-turn-helix domain-containing protein [Bartonella krasnovii]
MAKKEIEPKTEQAKRLRLIRESLELNRDQIATRLGIKKAIYDHAERGTTFPNVEFLTALSQQLNVNLTWLVTGEGEMFSDMAKAKAVGFKMPTIPAGLMKKLGRIAYTTYRDENIKLPPEDIAELAADLYKKLQELVQDINDTEEIELTLPLLKLHLKRQIEAEKEHSKTTQDTA